MSDVSNDDSDLANWKTDVAATEWVRGARWSHPSPEFASALAEARAKTEAAHAIVTSLAALRRVVGLNQAELGKRWGHTQSFVSRVERDPAGVEMATLVGYVKALGGRLSITVEAGDHVFYEDLVVGL